MLVKPRRVSEIRDKETFTSTGNNSVTIDNNRGKDIEILDITMILYGTSSYDNSFAPALAWVQEPTPDLKRDYITVGRFNRMYKNASSVIHHWHGHFIWKRGKRLILQIYLTNVPAGGVILYYTIKWRFADYE